MDTDTLAELAENTSRDEFAAKLPHFFLVIEAALFDQEQVGFSTQVVDPLTLRRGQPAKPSKNFEIIEVIKAPANPYPDRVSVGRARNCDVVLRDPSVSKLHAHFRVGGGKLELVDIDSQNGTRVNGRPLPPHQPQLMANEDMILFGSVAAKLVDAPTLYDLLK